MGRNVAAGMTGGLAYILDEDETLIPKVSAKTKFLKLPVDYYLKACSLIQTHLFCHGLSSYVAMLLKIMVA